LAADSSVNSGIADRYATALFDLAKDQGALDTVESDLGDLSGMLSESEDLDRLVRSPVIARAEQASAMAAVLDKAGVGALVRNFVGVVANNNRLFALKSIITSYKAMMAAHRGEVSAEVVAAQPLDDEQKSRVADALKTAIGQDVNIDVRIDESLIGGMVVRVGSRMVDMSLATKLQGLRVAMKGVG